MKAWTSDFSATPIPLMRCRLYGEVSAPVLLHKDATGCKWVSENTPSETV
jgi:hypothetical protein